MSGGPRRAAVTFIFVTVMLDMLALGMIIPVLPALIKAFRGGDMAAAAQTIGLFGTTWAGVQFFASPVLGSLSDRFGRRPIILLSNFGLGFDYVLMALAPSLGWLFVGRLLSGVTAASIPTAFAYIADVTTPENRAKSFGLIGAAFGAGFIIGPALGGMLATFGPRAPFWCAAAFSIANGLYGIFVLPESLDAAHRAPFSWKRANAFGALKLLRRHPELFGLASVYFLYHLAHQALQSVFVLYTDYRYGWGPTQVGWALAAVGVCFAIVQGALVGRAVAAFGERRALMLGLACGATGFFIYGMAPVGWIFALGIPIMTFWGLFGPAAQGLMTRHVSRSEQGALQGALTSVAGVTGIIGPELFSQTFAAAINPRRDLHYPGAPYVLASLLLVAGLVIAARATSTEDT